MRQTNLDQPSVDEQYLRALFDTIPIATTVLDPVTKTIRQVNRAFLDLVGLSQDDVVGCAPPYPWDEQDDVFRHSSGRRIPVRIDSHLVPGPDGGPIVRLALITDLSEKTRLEQQLVQSGKLAAIGELAAGVAHEINNPLFAILGLTEFLLKEAEPGSKAHGRLELIQQTGLEIKEIVRALLDFARENAEERRVVPFEDVVRQTVALVRRTNAHKGVELVETYSASGALVSASPNQLKQIFLNLVGNARQAMPEGGTVRIDVRGDGDAVLATVSDDGPGIDSALQARVSVSRGIAEAHGGSLTVSSAPGEGATFALRLPVVDAVAT